MPRREAVSGRGERKGFKREYRDHRLDMMVRAGGIGVVVEGLKRDNVSLADGFGVLGVANYVCRFAFPGLSFRGEMRSCEAIDRLLWLRQSNSDTISRSTFCRVCFPSPTS
jgi:hypothetical protein